MVVRACIKGNGMSDKLLNYAAQTLKLYAGRMRVAKDDRGFPWSMTDAYTRARLIKPFGYLYYTINTSPLRLAKSDEAISEVRNLIFSVLERCGIKRIKNHKRLKKISNRVWDDMFSSTTPFMFMNIFQIYARCRGLEEQKKWAKARALWGFEMQNIAQKAREKLREERQKKRSND